MTTRDFPDRSGFPPDPTPDEVQEHVRHGAEALVANCCALPSMTTLAGRNSLHECNAVLGHLIAESSQLLRAGNGAATLRAWAAGRPSPVEE